MERTKPDNTIEKQTIPLYYIDELGLCYIPPKYFDCSIENDGVVINSGKDLLEGIAPNKIAIESAKTKWGDKLKGQPSKYYPSRVVNLEQAIKSATATRAFAASIAAYRNSRKQFETLLSICGWSSCFYPSQVKIEVTDMVDYTTLVKHRIEFAPTTTLSNRLNELNEWLMCYFLTELKCGDYETIKDTLSPSCLQGSTYGHLQIRIEIVSYDEEDNRWGNSYPRRSSVVTYQGLESIFSKLMQGYTVHATIE